MGIAGKRISDRENSQCKDRRMSILTIFKKEARMPPVARGKLGRK